MSIVISIDPSSIYISFDNKFKKLPNYISKSYLWDTISYINMQS